MSATKCLVWIRIIAKPLTSPRRSGLRSRILLRVHMHMYMHTRAHAHTNTHTHLETAGLSCRTLGEIDWVINHFFFHDTWRIISHLWYCRRSVNTRCLHPLNTLAAFYELFNKITKTIISFKIFC